MLGGGLVCGRLMAQGVALPAWAAGVLEIHHIDTGRGNATLVIAPDGTTLLIDAGEAHSAPETMPAPRPDGVRRAGEYVARYVKRQLARVRGASGDSSLDYALMTHLHGDHVGEVTGSSPESTRGRYRLTGAGDVAEGLQVERWLDRGWPDYNYPLPPTDASAQNYIAMVRALAQRGTVVEQAKAGSVLGLRHDAGRYTGFSTRIVSVNGRVWSGVGTGSKALFPALEGVAKADYPDENMCCVSLVMEYGRFRYYAGGDLKSDTNYGRLPWHDIETPVAERVGAVTVASANHHGYFDACGPAMVRALRPRVWVLPTWHVTHPALSVTANLASRELYAGERSIYALEMAHAAELVNERFSRSLRSTSGHVVVRVMPGGERYSVHVVDAKDEVGNVVLTDDLSV